MEDGAERPIHPDRSGTPRRIAFPDRAVAAARMAWRCVLIAAGVIFVVVPFGYAASGDYIQVVRGAGYGLVVGIGLALRTHRPERAWLGLLIGSVVGLATVQILVSLPPTFQGPFNTLPPAMALAMAMIDGFGEPRLQGYRDAVREASIVSLMLTGLAFVPDTGVLFFMPWCFVPAMALIAGFFTRTADGKRFARPPALLILTALVMTVSLSLLLVDAGEAAGIGPAAWSIAESTIAVPLAVFLVARAAALWLDPRLLIYGQLAAYLRVMWVPIGGFAIGYMVIIVLFAGFYGMLAHFSPGAFTGVGEDAGIMTWVSFAFFTGVGRDYSGIVPVSAGAQALVGAQLIPSIGWALVVFAAVMAFIQPQLERIARRDAERQGD